MSFKRRGPLPCVFFVALKSCFMTGWPTPRGRLLVGRLKSALEGWKPPRFGTLRLTVLWTSIISLPAWSKQLTDLLGWLGILSLLRSILPHRVYSTRGKKKGGRGRPLDLFAYNTNSKNLKNS